MPAKTQAAMRRQPLHLGMDEPARKWMFKTAKANLWRVAAWYDFDDLIQDGLLCYQIVRHRYPHAEDRPNIMALFKRVYLNRITDMARARTKQAFEQPCESLELLNALCPDAVMVEFVMQAPTQVRQLLQTVLANPQLLARPTRRYLDGTRESTNKWLHGLIGTDDDNDLARALREHLGVTR